MKMWLKLPRGDENINCYEAKPEPNLKNRGVIKFVAKIN